MSSSRQYNVNLAFSADTSSAQQQLKELQSTLQNIAKLPGSAENIFDDAEIRSASEAAMELQQHLQAAVNVNTGNLDLSRFSTSLKTSGASLEEYYNRLVKIGPQGEQAFLQVASAISSAEAPVRTINSKLAEFGVTLKNTAKWQISSSILHGFMSTLSSAYNYAQDLNESLNNIRIVTGQSTEEMAAFAEKANTAAKALSTTTTTYTDAALIYYQQGLSDKEVEERTNVTVKLANVAGESADTVSEWMTAIWNNFDDGSETLEHYADVMTALGATTASSSAEIAEGINKFASVADTVGLSYEYAASALATVTAETRESADVVGNAFKTLFARIQDLELGETLDDGTTLGTYAQALEKVGINIKDQQGNLKDMNDILDEMGSKWNDLAQDEQVALAENVAGTRQYTKLIALMDNWDTFQENLETANDAEGTLTEQADIYMESWEAAEKRVTAAAQAIYSELLNDNAFITGLNGVEKFLEGVSNVIEDLGGLKGVLSSVGSIFLAYFANKMPAAIQSLKQNFMVFTGQATKSMLEVQSTTKSYLDTLTSQKGASNAFTVQAEGIAKVNNMQSALIKSTKNLSAEEQAAYKLKIQLVQAVYQEAESIAKTTDSLEKEAQAQEKALASGTADGVEQLRIQYQEAEERATALERAVDELDNTCQGFDVQGFDELRTKSAQARQEADSLNEKFENVRKTFGLTAEETNALITKEDGYAAAIKKVKAAITEQTTAYRENLKIMAQLETTGEGVASQAQIWKDNISRIKESSTETAALKEKMSAYVEEIEKTAKSTGTFESLQGSIEKVKQSFATEGPEKWVEAFDNLNQSMNSSGGAFTTKIAELNTALTETEIKMEAMGIDTSGLKNYKKQVDELVESLRQQIAQLENANGLAGEMPKATFKMSSAMTAFGSSIMSTYTTLNSFKSLIDTITDEGSTGLEKFSAVASTTMSSMMLLNSITRVSESLMGVQWVSSAAKALTATLGLSAGVASLTVTLGIVAVAILALYFAAEKISEVYQEWKAATPEGQLEKVTEEAEELSEAFSDAKDKADSLKSAISGYTDAVDALNACTTGTQEWYDALDTVNEKIEDILEQYPELYKVANLFNSDGTLNQDVLDAYQTSAENTATLLQMGSVMSEVDVASATLNKRSSDVKTVYDHTKLSADEGSPNHVKISWDQVQSLLNNSSGSVTNQEIIDIIKENAKNGTDFSGKDFSELSSDEQDEFLEKQNDEIENASDAIQQLVDAINNAKNGLDVFQETVQNSSKNIMTQQLSNSDKEYSQTAIAAGAEAFSDAYQNSQYDTSYFESMSEGSITAEKNQDLLDTIGAAGNVAITTDDEGELLFSYIDEATGALKQYSATEIAAIAKVNYALQESQQVADDTQTAFEGLDTTAQSLSEAVTEGTQTDGSLHLTDYVKSSYTLEQAEDVNTSHSVAAAGISFDDVSSVAEATGSTMWEIYVALLEAFQNVANDFTTEEKTFLSHFNGLSIEEGQALIDANNNFKQKITDTEGLNTYRDASIGAQNADNAEGLTDFYNAVSEISWTSEDAAEQVMTLANKYGITGDSLEAFIKDIEALDHTYSISTTAINEQKAALDKILGDDGLSIGDIVSADDIDTLKAAGVEIDNYFKPMADGTYALTQKAEEFNNAVNQITVDALKAQLSDYQAARDQAVENSGLMEEAFTTTGLSGNANNANGQNWGKNRLGYAQSFEDIDYTGYSDEDQTKINKLLTIDIDEEGLELTQGDLDLIDEMIGTINESEANTQSQIISTASSLSELVSLMDEMGDNANYDDYATGLISLANQYDNCTEELQRYQKALSTGDAAQINSAASALELSVAAGELGEQFDLAAEDIEAYAKQLKSSSKYTGATSEELAELAKDQLRFDKAVNSAADSMDDWVNDLKVAAETGHLVTDSADAMREAYGNLLDIDGSPLSEQFLMDANNLELMKQALEGDQAAYEQLQAAVAQDLLISLGLSDEEALAKFTEDLAWIQSYSSETQGPIADLEVGASLDDTEFLDKLTEMVNAAGMTAQEATDYLSSMGIDAKVEEVTNESEETVAQEIIATPHLTEEKTYSPGTDSANNPIEAKATYPYVTYETKPVTAIKSTTATALKVTSASKSSGGNIKYNSSTTAHGGSNSTKSSGSSGSGGSGSSSTNSKISTIDKSKRTDYVTRHKEETDAVNTLAKAYEKAATASDRLYGKDKITSMKQEIELLKAQKTAQDNLNASYQKAVKEDTTALQYVAQKTKEMLSPEDTGNILGDGTEIFKFNDDGYISNYTEVMDLFWKKYESDLENYNTAIENYNTAYADQAESDASTVAATALETQKETLDNEKEILDELVDAINDFDTSNSNLREGLQSSQDLINSIQDENYSIWTYQLDLKVDINEKALTRINYYLDKLADDFYSMAESASLMCDKVSLATTMLNNDEISYTELNGLYAAGDISKEKYIEGLGTIYDNIYDKLSELNEIDQDMKTYYGDTLDAAADELSYYTDRLEHFSTVLDYYKDIVTLVNGEYDYENIGIVLEGQASVLKNRLDVATANYEMLKAEKEEMQALVDSQTNEETKEWLQESLQAITTAVDEAEEEVLSLTTEWAEKMKAIMENTMAAAAEAMEDAFTDNMGFDALMDSLDRLSAYQDVYLTKTNQIYETSKLMRTARQAADKSDNAAVKQRLKNFIDETQALQDKNQMSNLELEIQQAKYDLLVAEIALEEAQNAKSTVRLSRDSEGNYSYVYTADQDDISSAQQDLEDAQNRLYNIGLENTNSYGQKILELKQQFSDDLIALEEARANGEYKTEEEYEEAKKKLIEEYNKLFLAYSDQYTIALGVDANIQEEAWVNAYDNMITETDSWQNATTDYIEKCEEAYDSWQETVTSDSEIIESVLGDVQGSVDEVTEASQDLADEIIDDVIPAIEDELEAVRDAIGVYAEQRESIRELIEYYEELAEAILNAMSAAAGLTTEGAEDVSDYSLRMAQYLVSGGSTTDKAFESWISSRAEKMKNDAYSAYGSWADSLYNMMADFKTNEKVKEYVTAVANGEEYFTEAKVHSLGYDTGGYTGEWGTDGKLAFLHEKELVLNKEDTQNFLSAIQMIRDIADMIDLNTINNMVPQLLEAAGISASGTLEQSVHIEASFPSVTDRNEIEEAFNNLINTASQYANRKL